MNDAVVNKDEVVIRIEGENDTYNLTIKQRDSDDLPCRLPLNRCDFEQLMSGVYYNLDQIRKTKTYAKSIDIDENQCFKDLEKIVDLQLFDNLFGEYHYGQRDDAKICAKEMKTILTSEKPMRIRIELYREFFFPWGLLYFGKHQVRQRIEKDSFCGLKHTIEQKLIDKEKGLNYDPIRTNKKIPLSFNVNKKEIRVEYIKEQRDLFDRFSSSLDLSERKSKEDLIDDFSRNELYDAIMYFFCHAEVFYGNDKNKTPASESYIRLTPTTTKKLANITLASLRSFEDLKRPNTFRMGPLVFLNACESALIPPLFYHGFLSYFMTKGARGLVGTLCKIPTVFASKFGSIFLDRFMRGEKVDEIIWSLRKEFVSDHNNMLGLYYSSYCDPGLCLDNSSTEA